MEQNFEKKDVPYIVYEGAMARNERVNLRLIVVIIILISIIFASNAIWLYAWNQYDYVVDDYSLNYVQDGRGINIIGNENEVTDGTESYSEESETQED